MTVSDYIADQLLNAGVKYVFGIPGGPSIPYMESLRNAGIEFILTSNESAAGIMAAVTGRLTGNPGVCHSTFGPGATNLSTGVGCAFLDRDPVIVLTSEMSENWLNRTVQMNIDHQKIFTPLTKATFRLNQENAGKILRNALRICREEYPGPVHIGIPDNIADYEVISSGDDFKSDLPGYKNDIQKIISLLRKSRKPLAAVGLTAKRLGIGNDLKAFLEKYRIPFVTTPMAKGIISEEHPLFAGVLFHALSDYLDGLTGISDLIIGIGYDPVEYNYESWIPPVPLIHFDVKKTDLPPGDNVIDYVGKPDEWIRLLTNLDAGSLISESSAIKGIRDEMTAVFKGLTGNFGPVAAMNVLREELPGNTIVTADVGSHLHLAGQFWKTTDKGRFIITNGWSGMGFGIPAALAAKMNRPETPVACITGDGGFLMMAGEMVTARRYNLPIKVIVFSDGELNLINLKQSWKEIRPYGTSLYSGDLFDAGNFLGISVLRADSEESMRYSVSESLSMDRPVIINAVIDPGDYKWLIVKKPATG